MCYDTTSPDCMHVVNFVNKTVTLPTTGERWGRQVHPQPGGPAGGLQCAAGATGYVCSNLTTVEEPEDAETAVGSGKFVLVNEDDEVQVGWT